MRRSHEEELVKLAIKKRAPQLPWVSQSALTTFMACPMKQKLRREGWEKTGLKTPLTWGTLAHHVLEQGLKMAEAPTKAQVTGMLKKALKEATYSRLTADQIQDAENCAAEVQGVMVGYFNHYRNDWTSKFEMVEQEFKVPYPPSSPAFYLYGFIDRVVRKKDGIWILDTKTASRVDSEDIIATLPYSFQWMYYAVAVEHLLGEKPKGFIIDIIRKPSIRQKQTETKDDYLARLVDDCTKVRPEFYYHRFNEYVDPTEIEAFKKSLDEVYPIYLKFLRGKFPAFKNTMACTAKYKCDYIPICGAGDFSSFINTKKEKQKK